VNISRDQAKGIMVLVVIGGSLMTFSWLWLPHEFFVRYQLYPMGMLLTVAGAAVLAHLHQRESEHRLSQVEAKVADAKKQTQEQSQRAKPAWDLASANLELYFERNRAQVSQVCRISIVVMAAGFFVVLFSVYLALQNRGITPTLVAGISGIITQFIGATFMMIYRSTMTQTNEFMSLLERINTVGMAVQVLDSIPESEKLKNETRAKIVSLLLGGEGTSNC